MNLVKPFVILGSSGTLAAGAYLTKDSWMSSSKKRQEQTIANALQNRRLISSLQTSDLAKQWEEEFESDQETLKKLLGDSSLDKSKGGKALSEWCDGKMSLDVDKNKEIFKNVEKYCLIRSVASQLERKQKTLLKENQEQEWKSTYNKRKSTSSKRDDIGLNGADWNTDKESEDLPKVKEWCAANSGKDFLASDNNDIYTKVLKWCTSNGATES
ncbi:hypothetical protein MHC_04695 [Mycoplasma haemocanis str. Illinois]|uniref:Uncharacterized protein n=1 Tax=Mycoplasma haemocanis (strain Illinois) TaxID=1111676 RepID=H6N823_MYCHN|nr:hypothetical protein [Mycoplasma haemocanis]AEW45795.1 hypothetical protein MHC_04695 [Mycoplasma haemocanis str. Illinois]